MEIRVARKYRVGVKLGSGSFGEVYAGVNVETGEDIAMKLEPIKSRHPQLLDEAKVYRALKGGYGIPEVKWCGSEGDYNILITDLLGPSLEDLFIFCGKRFSLKTVLMIADQMISRLEFLHSRSYIHRDVKPENFLIGRGPRKVSMLTMEVNHMTHECYDAFQQLLYAIDFGLAKKFHPDQDSSYFYFGGDSSVTGTARYASIHAHSGDELSRRDDMESLGFVLMYFLRGSLPWQELYAPSKKQKCLKILERKQAVTPDQLCRGFPTEFKDYFNHVASLGFIDAPDYCHLKRMFKELFVRNGFEDDGLFDWELLKRERQMAGQQAGDHRTASSKLQDSTMPPTTAGDS